MNVRPPRRTPTVPLTTPTFSSPSHAAFYRKIAYTFFGITAVVLLGVVWLSSAKAEITIRAKRTAVRGENVVEIVSQPGGGSQIAGKVLTLPMRKTWEFTVAGVAESAPAPAPSSGTTSTGATTSSSVPVVTPSSSTAVAATTTSPTATAYARGQVTIVNTYSKAQTLVEKTRLLTQDGKLYRLSSRVVIPSGGRASVQVVADQPGEAFAIGPTKFTIPGLWIDLQPLIYAESSEAFTLATTGAAVKPAPAPTPTPNPVPAPTPRNGTGGERKIVTQQNLDLAYDELTNRVVEEAKKLLLANMDDARFTGAAYFVNTTGKSASVRAGQVAENFTAQVDVEVVGVFYSSDDMQQLVRARLREKLPEGQEFLPFTEQDFIYVPESVDKEGGRARLRVISNAEYRLMSTNPALQPSALAGKPRDEVESQLRSLEGVESAEVRLRPGWLGKLPRLSDHIQIELK
ncbi:hypothetical protein KBD13_01130 [Patescibacteria group bacterium]|nr:hypothetical protein [Patescibacteria group bacterium]